MLTGRDIQIAAQPIIWSNDDFHDLGGKTPLETCLAQMAQAGYAGTELGHKFPSGPSALADALAPHKLQLVSGWHSTYLLTRDFEAERAAFESHLALLSAMGSKVAIVAECSHRTYPDPDQPLQWDDRPALEGEAWARLCRGLDELGRVAAGAGLQVVYHHHMGTVIQSLAEVDRLMEGTKALHLLGDTGHLAFAGEDPVSVFRRYGERIGHVHLKNVRPAVVARARAERWSFAAAVRAGVFTVPGDEGLDFRPIFEVIRDVGYSGWMVVEAEQDPQKADPFVYAQLGRNYIREAAGL
jgi:inosose dehydratase